MSDNAPGWQSDPTGRFDHRYWDGSQWTENVANAGVASIDAYPGDVDAPAVVPPAPTAEAPDWGDPTTTQPTSTGDPTSAWPVPPPVPNITPPDGVGGGSAIASAGSRKGLLIGAALALAAAAVAVVVLSGDGDGDRPQPRTDSSFGDNAFGSGADLPANFEQELADAYESGMGLPRPKARCLAGKIADAIREGDLAEEEAMSDIFGYLSDCDINLSELGGN